MVDVDASTIKWREVTRDAYNLARFDVPHRETHLSSASVYELGTVPIQLPTKPGAIVTGPDEDWNPYVLSRDGKWYELEQSQRPYETEDETVAGYIESGDMRVVFEGVDV